MYPLKEPMHIHSLGGELAEATILERMGDNRYLAEYNGVKCSAIFTLRAQGATRLKRPTLAHFCVAVPRISAASPSLRRLELNQSRLRSGRRVFTIRAPNRTRRGPAGIAVPMSRGRNNVLWGHGP